MSFIEHVIKFSPPKMFRTAEVRGMFDYQAETVEQKWRVEIPDDSESWQVGVIVGPSGSGKTQIASKRFGADALCLPKWDSLPIVENFDKTMKTSAVCDLLTRVGLGSVPAWLLPYHALSNGQRFRADMARLLSEDNKQMIVVDEFSSVIDRTVAKTTSAVLSKFVRKNDRRFVAVSCHYDIIDWLEPDWVLDMASGMLARGNLWRRPKIKLSICEADYSCWKLFKRHHYLSGDLHKAAKRYVALIDGEPCAFLAITHYPHRYLGYVYRVHRVVTMPDYQGLGIATRMMAAVARTLDRDLYISTSHRPFAVSLARSADWVQVRRRGFSSPPSKTAAIKGGHRQLVLSAGFKFVGKATKTVDPHTKPEYRA